MWVLSLRGGDGVLGVGFEAFLGVLLVVGWFWIVRVVQGFGVRVLWSGGFQFFFVGDFGFFWLWVRFWGLLGGFFDCVSGLL